MSFASAALVWLINYNTTVPLHLKLEIMLVTVVLIITFGVTTVSMTYFPSPLPDSVCLSSPLDCNNTLRKYRSYKDRLCGQSFWLQIQRSRVRFPALPDFLSSRGLERGPLSLVRSIEELLE